MVKPLDNEAILNIKKKTSNDDSSSDSDSEVSEDEENNINRYSRIRMMLKNYVFLR